MALTGDQYMLFVDALCATFDENSLAQFVKFRLDADLHVVYASHGVFRDMTFAFVSKVEKMDETVRVLELLVKERPRELRFRELATALGAVLPPMSGPEDNSTSTRSTHSDPDGVIQRDLYYVAAHALLTTIVAYVLATIAFQLFTENDLASYINALSACFAIQSVGVALYEVLVGAKGVRQLWMEKMATARKGIADSQSNKVIRRLWLVLYGVFLLPLMILTILILVAIAFVFFIYWGISSGLLYTVEPHDTAIQLARNSIAMAYAACIGVAELVSRTGSRIWHRVKNRFRQKVA